MADISERIAQARKEAEDMKEKIRVNRDKVNDTTCRCFLSERAVLVCVAHHE
jgi:guanine nucleotide-binding protein G(I)/G(S)/G(T) subunit beta-1